MKQVFKMNSIIECATSLMQYNKLFKLPDKSQIDIKQIKN